MYELCNVLEFSDEFIVWCIWEILLDPSDPENYLAKSPQELAAMIKFDAAAWLRTRLRTPR